MVSFLAQNKEVWNFFTGGNTSLELNQKVRDRLLTVLVFSGSPVISQYDGKGCACGMTELGSHVGGIPPPILWRARILRPGLH